MRLTISAEHAKRIAARLPAGKTIDDIRIVECEAQIVTAEELEPTDRALIASEIEKAGGPALISNGLPTIMRIVAWMAHEGKNKNGLIFQADDFGLAADRIREPNFLPMDWNHSAVMPWSFDPKAIGLWYRAEKRWDPKANDNKGAYGILAYGVMWAWLFQSYANDMLAEQERHGHIRFSMACIPESLTITADGEIAHNPLFFTLSALDVPNADPDANGIGVEGSDDATLEDTLTQQLVSATTVAAPALEAAAAREPDAQVEENMDELMKEIAALKAQIAAMTEQQEQAEATKAQQDALAAEVESLKAKVTEVETARDAALADAATMKEQAETLKAQLDEATAQLETIAAAEQEAQAEARWTARKESLPESYRKALEKKAAEEQARFEKKWKNASDEEWNEHVADLKAAFDGFQVSYLTITEKEGGALLTGGAGNSGVESEIADLLAAIKK